MDVAISTGNLRNDPPGWQDVAMLAPRLRSEVKFHRRRSFGSASFIVEAPSASRTFRLQYGGWRFVGLLDGRRTVMNAWLDCCAEISEQAPTQREVMKLLVDLGDAGMLAGESIADALHLSEKPRRAARATNLLQHLLYLRIPLVNIDRFVAKNCVFFELVFSRLGMLIWLCLVVAALVSLATAKASIGSGLANTFTAENLPWLYVAIVLTKALHEIAHAAACKVCGQRDGTGGSLGMLGVILVFFVPVPFIDASSAELLRRKRDRILVAATGVLAELAVAAVAALLWTRTNDGTTLHALCYNIMLLAGVSAVLLNANPLMRFDGYYILSDWLEIPNLADRSFRYLRQWIVQFAWGVHTGNSIPDAAERRRLLTYALASGIYRIAICGLIIYTIADRYFVFGSLLAFAAIYAWFVRPLIRLAYYIRTAPQLEGKRCRAAGTTMIATALLAALLFLFPVSDRVIIDGVIESLHVEEIHAVEDGFVSFVAAPGSTVATGQVLVTIESHSLSSALQVAALDQQIGDAAIRIALRDGNAIGVQVGRQQHDNATQRSAHLSTQIAAMTIPASFNGDWVPIAQHRAPGAFVKRGDLIGTLVANDAMTFRGVGSQNIASQLFAEPPRDAFVVRPGIAHTKVLARVEYLIPAGQLKLPSASLGRATGGPVAQDEYSARSDESDEPFFVVNLIPDDNFGMAHGQRTRGLIRYSPKPIGYRWLRDLHRALQRRD